MSIKIRAANAAIKKAGGASALAMKLLPRAKYPELLKMQSRIAKWKLNGVPGRWVAPVHDITGHPRHLLAPEIYTK